MATSLPDPPRAATPRSSQEIRRELSHAVHVMIGVRRQPWRDECDVIVQALRWVLGEADESPVAYMLADMECFDIAASMREGASA